VRRTFLGAAYVSPPREEFRDEHPLMNKLPHLPHPDSSPLDPQKFDEPLPESTLLRWTARLRLLTNGNVWRDLLAALGVACVLLTALLLGISKSGMVLVAGGSLFVGFVLLYVLIAAVIDRFGQFHATFVLTSRGVRSLAGRDLPFEQDVFIPYAHIAKIRLCDGSGSILVEGSLVEKPIRLYCTTENQDQVEEILREHCPSFIFA
jgi:hypothetical protein